ncbi:glycosyltransferase family 4 protein [Janibacter cremeus]|uniref:Glycosyltransferase involved in cell wall biosynthesis n=1 Tax=Janibacter cremeus TaxID=1285192 RepID=A0A852VQ09_9MICO|nr:glycosyltransferase family 4 protein [Janibacter cremeus]NYF99052.1 glycosyltransferase involved in cell wall biosynthesis [Janibacter cremeus]
MVAVHWVSNETPDQFGQGGQRRQFFQIRALAEAGHTVRVVTLAGPQDDTSVRAVADDVHRLPPLEWRGRLPRPGRRRALRRRLAAWGEVVVVAHGESWERFGWAAPKDRPTVVDLHNVFSRWSGSGSSSRAWLDLERRIRHEATVVTVTSAREAASLIDGPAPVLVVENGIDPQEWSIEPAPASTPVLKLFGNWSWQPNTVGLNWFINEVWPSVHLATGATCAVAGSGLDPAIAAAPGVEAWGRVDDLQAFLSDAWAIAIPLPESVGAPVKYAEALAVGVPVITTDQGAPGYRGLPRIADERDEWIPALTEWLDTEGPPTRLDPEQRQARLDTLAWTTATAPLATWVSGHGEDVDLAPRPTRSRP